MPDCRFKSSSSFTGSPSPDGPRRRASALILVASAVVAVVVLGPPWCWATRRGGCTTATASRSSRPTTAGRGGCGTPTGAGTSAGSGAPSRWRTCGPFPAAASWWRSRRASASSRQAGLLRRTHAETQPGVRRPARRATPRGQAVRHAERSRPGGQAGGCAREAMRFVSQGRGRVARGLDRHSPAAGEPLPGGAAGQGRRRAAVGSASAGRQGSEAGGAPCRCRRAPRSAAGSTTTVRKASST